MRRADICWASLGHREKANVSSDSLQSRGLTGVGSLSLPLDLRNPGIEPRCLALQADSSPAEPQGTPRILEWVAYLFCSRSSRPRNWTGKLQADSLPAELSGKPALGHPGLGKCDLTFSSLLGESGPASLPERLRKKPRWSEAAHSPSAAVRKEAWGHGWAAPTVAWVLFHLRALQLWHLTLSTGGSGVSAADECGGASAGSEVGGGSGRSLSGHPGSPGWAQRSSQHSPGCSRPPAQLAWLPAPSGMGLGCARPLAPGWGWRREQRLPGKTLSSWGTRGSCQAACYFLLVFWSWGNPHSDSHHLTWPLLLASSKLRQPGSGQD